MKTRIAHALSLAVLLALLVTTVAAAESGGGTGTLTAKGNGFAALRGNLTVTLSGSGLLLIRDEGGDATINVTGRGYRRELPGGAIAYVGFDGKAEIKASAISVSLRGRNIRLKATGTGRFVLRGHGSYHTEHENGAWTDAGKVVVLP